MDTILVNLLGCIFEMFLYFGLVLAVSNIITQEYIFSRFRNWIHKTFPFNTFFNTLINCPTCISFWVGLLCLPLFPFLSGYYWFVFPLFSTFITKLVFSRLEL